MECYSHPGKLLREHLNKVCEIGLGIHRKLNLSFGLEDNKLEKLLINCLRLHDFGKATEFFQEYLECSSNKTNYKKEIKYTRHSLISAIYSAYKTLQDTSDFKLSLICFIVILKHHGDLENIEDNIFLKNSDNEILKMQYDSILWNGLGLSDLEKYNWDKLKEFIDTLWLKHQDLEFTMADFFITKYLYSILVYSDKNEVVFEGSLDYNASCIDMDLASLIPIYKEKRFGGIDKNNELIQLRKKFYDNTIKKIKNLNFIPRVIFVNAPTGLGKTITGLQIAFELLEKNKNIERIIYAVPFTSIIDQIEGNVEEIFKSNNKDPKKYFLKHHHLIEPSVKIDEDWYLYGKEGQFLIENWDKPLILTTFWQIFNTLFLGDNKLNRKFHKLANSIIILDEIQIVPLKYWKLIRDILTFLTEKMNCCVIYMTATIPLIFTQEQTANSILIKLEQNELNFLDRYQLDIIENLNPIPKETIFEHIKKELKNNPLKNFLFVLNTINESLIFFDEINKIKDKKDELYYLSTNIIPKDRKDIIDTIKQKLSCKQNRIILVSTQLIEAGVDLDFDIVYRDLAPIDSIIQTSGRCNRNNREKGKVYLFSLINEENKKYCSFIYDDLSLSPTINILGSKTKIDEKNVIEILDEYFKEVQQRMDSNIYNEILSYIRALKFKKVSESFKLIDESPDILLFIEKDDDATQVISKYKELREKYKGYEFNNKFLEIKKKFYEYVISKRLRQNELKVLKCFEEIGNFYIVPKELLPQFYDENKGFFVSSDSFY